MGAEILALSPPMEDVISSKTSTLFRVRTVEPAVIRLPNGHVQVTGDSPRFPDSCPRCGSMPAKTLVKLRASKVRRKKSEQGSVAPVQPAIKVARGETLTKIPFCRRCGWTLKITQFLPGILGCGVIAFLDPRIQNFRPSGIPWFSAGTAVIAGMLTAALVNVVFEYLPTLLIDPGVKVVTVGKGIVELAFDDQLYAEKFVLLNR
jgi:hypothetical protein